MTHLAHRLLVPLGACVACVQLALSASPAQVEGVSPFRSRVDLVALNVTPLDQYHRVVDGLTQEDFTVLEDGVAQDISFFSVDRIPLDVGVLLDASASMAKRLSVAQRAAIGFIQTMAPNDRVLPIEITDRANVLLPLGSDMGAAIDAIRRAMARGSTALYDGLYLAMREMSRRRDSGDTRRAALVLLSDGRDTVSLTRFEDVTALAKGSGVAIYTIALQDPPRGRNADTSGDAQALFVMRTLAHETGGLLYRADSIHALDGIYSDIARVLAQQYTIGYVSKNPKADGSFRRISVKLSHQPGVTVHARSGYYASTTRLSGSAQ